MRRIPWHYAAILIATGALVGENSARAQTTLDLTTAGASASSTSAPIGAKPGSSFSVYQDTSQNFGTGFINSFVRIQQTGNEQGFNTSLGTPLDTKGGNFTRALATSELANVVGPGGVAYKEFLLDINQQNNTPNFLLNLNQIQIFQAPADTQTYNFNSPGAPGTSSTPPVINIPGATEIFRMNNSSTAFQTILLSGNIQQGSGYGDMALLVRADLFTNLPNVILYSQFGNPPGANASNAGFEEWAAVTCGIKPVPEPSTLAIAGLGALGFGVHAWKRARARRRA